MLDQMRLLIKLQAVDKTVFSLEKELQEIPEKLALLTQEEEAAKAEYEKVSAELAALQAQRKGLEDENEVVKGRLRKAETKLMNSTNQREHRAATAELEEGRDIIKSNDDTLLQIMEKQEPLETRAQNMAQALVAKTEALNSAKEQLSARTEEARKILSEITANRAETESQVEKTLLREYDYVRTRRQGVGIAAVSKGNCGVCHMQISPQQFNELLRGDKLMHCPSCKRIIYWAEAEGLDA